MQPRSHAPFERPVLKSFEKDLTAVLLYSGFAWGAGAFLTVASAAGALAAFAALPALCWRVLLRARNPVLLFVAPVAALSLLACLIRQTGAMTRRSS